jgi:DNA adenine methylase
VEPFGGAASVLLRKDPAPTEVYNDLDGCAVNLFRVLRSPEAPRLVRELYLTPYAREEFILAYERTDDPVERARRLVVRSFMGFGSNSHTKRCGFRSKSAKSRVTPAVDWENYPDNLKYVIERLRGVSIDNRDALHVMRTHDGPETLHYVDPPYVSSVRDVGRDYRHEMGDEDHVRLLEFLIDLEGSVVLSGYANDMYDDRLEGWVRRDKKSMADGAKPRTESVWLNPRCLSLLKEEGSLRL